MDDIYLKQGSKCIGYEKKIICGRNSNDINNDMYCSMFKY